MKRNMNQKGITLVEIIVALAILGIISITFLTVFTGMFRGIAIGGNRGTATFGAQQDIEGKMTDESVVSTGNTTSVAITNSSVNVTVTGKIIKGSGTGGENANVRVDVDVNVFVPR